MNRINHSSRFIEMFGNPADCQNIWSSCIGDYCRVVSGYPFKSGLFNEDGNGRPLIRIRDVVRGYTETYTTENCDEQYVVKAGDLLIGMDGYFEISPWKSKDALLNQRVCMIAPKVDMITKNLIIYAVQPVLTLIENQTNATTVKHISASQVSNIRVPELVYDKVKAFDSIVNQSDKSKFNGFKSRFFEQFADLPFDHKWKDVLTIINGKAYGEEYKVSGTYPICGSGGIMGYGEKKMCNRDSIILGRKGNIDKPIYMSEDYWIVDTAFCLSPNTELIHPVYLYHWCKQFDFQKLNKQAVLPSLTRADLEQIDIQVPEMAEQLAFVAIVRQADKSKYLN